MPPEGSRATRQGHKGDGSHCAPEGAQWEPSPVKSPALSITEVAEHAGSIAATKLA